MESTTLNRLSSKALKLYDTGLHSDMELVCRDRRWKLHRAIVFESSEAFAAADSGNDEVSTPVHATEMCSSGIGRTMWWCCTSHGFFRAGGSHGPEFL